MFRVSSMRMSFALCAALLLSVSTAPARAESAIYQQTVGATAWILNGPATGSGALVNVEHRLIVTNDHVVGNSPEVIAFFPKFEDGKLVAKRDFYLRNHADLGIKGRVVARDPKRDLALIQLASLPEGASALTLASASSAPGERIHSIGNPGASGALWVYTSGTVRQVYRDTFPMAHGVVLDAVVVESQSPINPGDSGGPVVNNQGELVAVTQSYRQGATLVSLAVDVTEVAAFLQGDNRTVDSRVKDALTGAGLSYAVSVYGVYQIPFRFENGPSQTVFINSDTVQFGTMEIREVHAAAIASDQPFSSAWLAKLLSSNPQMRLGAWEIRVVGGKHFAVFCAKIPADTSASDLAAVVQAVLRTCALTRVEFEKELAESTQGKEAVFGEWKAALRDPSGSHSTLYLRLNPEGDFVWRVGGLPTVQGTYRYSDGKLQLAVDGKATSKGTIKWVSLSRFVLELEEDSITFDRSA